MMAKKTPSLQRKRKLLVNQSGGFLPAIAPVIISALSGILSRVISEKV